MIIFRTFQMTIFRLFSVIYPEKDDILRVMNSVPPGPGGKGTF